MHNAEVQSIPDSVSPKHPPKKPTGWKQFNSANTQYPNIPIKKKKKTSCPSKYGISKEKISGYIITEEQNWHSVEAGVDWWAKQASEKRLFSAAS